MRTVPEYAKNFLFCIKNFWKFFFKMYKNFIDIWFCIFTISSSCTLHPWPSNCFLYKLFVIKLSKNHFKHCLNIDCQLFIGQTLKNRILSSFNLSTLSIYNFFGLVRKDNQKAFPSSWFSIDLIRKWRTPKAKCGRKSDFYNIGPVNTFCF